jgi:elongation factor P
LIPADEVWEGAILRIDGRLHKVMTVGFGGTAKAGRVVHLKLRDLTTRTDSERTLSGSEMVEDVHLDKCSMTYLYNDGENFYFMNTETYEQLPISKEVVGPIAPYLKENTEIQVEFYEGEPVNILFPKTIELKVISAPPGIHVSDSTTFKEVTLENEVKILVPQFISEGDVVKIEVETGKYLDRVKKSEREGGK